MKTNKQIWLVVIGSGSGMARMCADSVSVKNLGGLSFPG